MHRRTNLFLALVAIAQLVLCVCRPEDAVWKDLAPIPIAPRQEHTTVAISPTTLGILGGIVPNGTEWDTTALMQLYDIPSNTWKIVTPLPMALNHPNAAAVDGKVYLLGGLRAAPDGAWRAVPDSWVYDPETNTWAALKPMPGGLERGSATTGVYGKTIFLAGGMRTLRPGPGGEQDTVDTVSAYDVESGTWTSLPEAASRLPARRDHAGGAVVDQTFYVIGGRDRGQVNVRDTVFALNLEDLALGWITKSAKMPTPRGGIAASAVSTLVYTFGGEGSVAAGSGGVFNETEVYDTESGTWQQLKPMKLPRHGTSAVGIGKGIFIPGGGVSQGANGVNTFDVFYP
ncbi:hypothetical protein FALCPG4_016049 [Fusarium falciforme]